MTWFTRLKNWVNDSNNGIGIRADYHDSEDDNFASGINQCLNIAGLNTPTSNISMGNYKFTNAADGTSSADYATVKQVQTRIVAYAADSVGTDSYAITLSPALTSYVVGQQFVFAAGTANTGAATLNINGLGAKTIKKDKDADLNDGDIAQNQMVSVIYDGTNFQMQTPAHGQMNQTLSAIYAADGGGSDSYSITLIPAPSSYVVGMMINFKANTANTGTASLNVNGLGAKTIVKDGSLTLNNNDIKASQIIQVIYDGTNFQMISPMSYLANQDGHINYAADAGANDTYVITLTPAPPAYVTGMVFNFKANTLNTGACTLNVNSLGAIAIKKFGTSTDTETGDILAGQIVSVIYDGTNFQMISAVPAIHSQTNWTTPIGADELPIYDSANAANKRITLSNLINGQTEDTSPDPTADYVQTYDASASGTKKVKLQNIGSWVKISTATASSSASISFTGLTSTYLQYIVILNKVLPATDNVYMYVRTSSNNGVSYDSGASNYAYTQVGSEGGTYISPTSAGDTLIKIAGASTQGCSFTAGEGVTGQVQIIGHSDSAVCQIQGLLGYQGHSTPYTVPLIFQGRRLTASAVNAIQFAMSSGNIASGTFTLYGQIA